MDTYYHGSSVLFDKFDLLHALSGDGKVKFGYGVYLTSVLSSAALYSGSGAGKNAPIHYVYSVETPELVEGNYLQYKREVHPSIVKRTEEKLGITIPAKVLGGGKDFRKYLAKYLTNSKKVDVQGEKAAAEFLDSIGVVCSVWPYSWTKEDSPMNRAVFNDANVRISRRLRL